MAPLNIDARPDDIGSKAVWTKGFWKSSNFLGLSRVICQQEDLSSRSQRDETPVNYQVDCVRDGGLWKSDRDLRM